jgi:atypical dual specificity phosphatase
MSLQHPVVCEQVGQRPLYLGSARAASEGVVDHEFAHVISVSSYSQPRTTKFVPLVDGSGVEYEKFKRAVEAARAGYQQKAPTLVHCEVGISRSTAVLATVIAAEDKMTFEEALEEIRLYRPRASPQRPLRECAKHYLQEETSESQLLTI